MKYVAFDKQQDFHLSPARIRGAFAGKRGGKTEAGAIESIIFTEQKKGYRPNGVDPYLGVVIAPTTDMLRRLSLKKLKAYAGKMISNHHETHGEITWHNGAEILAISADKPQRLEGVKANWIWIDEVFQVKESLFQESLARVADNEGFIWCTGSLGTQYNNPKSHWAYKYFKETPFDGSEVFEWTTSDNPHFPRAELDRMRENLDARTFRQMYELSWDVPGSALVYDELSEANFITGYQYNPKLPTFVSIDWGWTHPMACLFIQYDPILDRVYVFDEVVKSKLKIETLYAEIMARPYSYSGFICDIAGSQEREQTGISNIEWFKNKGIKFLYRQSAVNKGIAIVRSYVRNSKGVARLFIDRGKCPKTTDALMNYSYPEKDGVITSESPLEHMDDAPDALRYYFVVRHDSLLKLNEVQMIKR